MEGADAYEASVTRTFQRHKILDDRCNICMGLELLNNFVRVERHDPNLARKSHKKKNPFLKNRIPF